MQPLDNGPDRPEAGDPQAVEKALRAVTQDLRHLQQDLVVKFSEDFTRLLSETSRLSEEIDKLLIQQQQQQQFQKLQSLSQEQKAQQEQLVERLESLSQQQKAQQEQLTAQLADLVAAQVQERLSPQIDELAAAAKQSVAAADARLAPASNAGRDRRGAGVFLASMDGTLMANYEAAREELDGYQNRLAEHLKRLNSLQQQGEVVLEALVNRLIEQLKQEGNAVPTAAELSQEDLEHILQNSQPAQLGPQLNSGKTPVLAPSSKPVAPPVPPVPEAPIAQPVVPKAPAPAAAPKPASLVQVGLVLALISSVVLSLFNVSLKIILKAKAPRMIFGIWQLQGFISPGFGNSLLILLLRTIVVIAVMPILATFLYPQVWQDLNRFFKSRDPDQWLKVVGSGFFLFLSQVLIYIAIGNIPTGIAITIFFIYPIVTVLASWWLFADKPSIVRIAAMGVITGGGVLALPAGGAQGNLQLGVAAAVGAGIAFAGYVLTAQLGQKKLHPIPFTLVGFLSILVFCTVSLLLPLPKAMAVQFNWSLWPSLVIGSAILGLFTLASYLLNNFAIRFAGAALASIIGTSGPALTALFGFVIIGEKLLAMQIFGMVLVTLGVAAMSVERMLAQKKPAAQTAK
ncbi:DMT family transporter [Kamptonema formosum]|uniref:DMT family transporter n=1 Tax=Kamptonema formosum TaxID=331992 RepID=UPI00034A16DD|nr:DMT family transporter [Oscillatoria sp. PCC 10802]